MDLAEISVDEAIRLGAVDGPLYAQFFFPKAVRQQTPWFHTQMWHDLDDPSARYVAWKVFRDGAKTTLLRVATSRRIAYAISRTIVYTSASEGHAVRSVKWLRRQVEVNTRWASAFGLRRGAKWSDNEIEIFHGVEEIPIYVLAVGITGQIRGINEDDFRPDFIVCDDPDNEETTGTPEQREKISGLFFGALANGLAPASESPLAKMALAQTPLAEGDLIDQCSKDPSWRTSTYGILDEEQQSRWPDRYSTEVVLQEKQNYIARNQLSLWMREKECKIVGREMASFRKEWLNFYETLPDVGWDLIAVDPAISDAKTADYFAVVHWRCVGRRRYLVDYTQRRGVEPDQAVNDIVERVLRYRRSIRKIVVETVAFQKVLAKYLRKALLAAGCYRPIQEVDDKRGKADVILQSYLDYAPLGLLYVREGQTEFLEAYLTWNPLYTGHQDLLDAGARGLDASGTSGAEADEDPANEDYEPLPQGWRSAP